MKKHTTILAIVALSQALGTQASGQGIPKLAGPKIPMPKLSAPQVAPPKAKSAPSAQPATSAPPTYLLGSGPSSPGVSSDALKAAEDLPLYLEKVQSSLNAPDACEVNSISDFSYARKAEGVSNVQGCSNFFNYACESKKHANRQLEASRRYDLLEIESVIDSIPASNPARAAMEEALKNLRQNIEAGKNLDVPFENPSAFEALKGKKPKTKEEKAMVAGKKEGLLNSDALKAYQNAKIELINSKALERRVFEKVKKRLPEAARVLSEVRAKMMEALNEQQASVLRSYDLSKKNDPNYERNHNFVLASFERMKNAINEVSLDETAIKDSCVRDQRNAFLVGAGERGSKPRIVVCPATLLSGDNMEIAGAIATAMGHALDGCSMDKMKVGAAPEVPLSMILEPLRSCLADQSKPNKSKTGITTSSEISIRDFLQPPPAGSSAAYKDAVSVATRGLGVRGFSAPHCNKPVTAADIKKRDSEFEQRDQSNDVLAQFFGTAALSKLVQSKPSLDNIHVRGQDPKLAFAVGFAPYCDALFNPKSSHPDPKLLLANIVGRDQNTRQVLGCTGASTERARIETAGSRHFAEAGFDEQKLGKQAPTGCESRLAKGFSDYIRVFDQDSAYRGVRFQLSGLSPVVLNNINVPERRGGMAASEEPAAEVDGAAAKAAQQQASGSQDAAQNPSLAKDQRSTKLAPIQIEGPKEAITDFSTATAEKLIERRESIEKALVAVGKECHDKANAGHNPVPEEILADKCTKGVGRTDIGLNWADGSATRTVQVGAYSFEVGCQARCLCGAKDCYYPEATYVAQGEPKELKPVLRKETVLADYSHYLEADKSRGRYALAAKSCYMFGPDAVGSDVAGACKQAGASSVKLNGQPVSFIGETSGALLKIKCEFTCSCGNPKGCDVEMGRLQQEMPGLATAADRAKAEAPIAKADDAVYLRHVPAITISGTAMAQGGKAPASASAPAPKAQDAGPNGDAPAVQPAAEPVRVSNDFKFLEPLLDASKLGDFDKQRLKYRKESADEVGLACVNALNVELERRRKATQLSGLTSQQAFCESFGNLAPFKGLRIQSRQGSTVQGDVQLSFAYECGYHCGCAGQSVERCTTRKYLGEEGPQKVSTSGKNGVESARAADWSILAPFADQECLGRLAGDGRMIAIQKRCAQGPHSLLADNVVCATRSKGDLLNVRLPYACDYKCDSLGTEKGAKAHALRLDADSIDAYAQFEAALGKRNCLEKERTSVMAVEGTPPFEDNKLQAQASCPSVESAEVLAICKKAKEKGFFQHNTKIAGPDNTDLVFGCQYHCSKDGKTASLQLAGVTPPPAISTPVRGEEAPKAETPKVETEAPKPEVQALPAVPASGPQHFEKEEGVSRTDAPAAQASPAVTAPVAKDQPQVVAPVKSSKTKAMPQPIPPLPRKEEEPSEPAKPSATPAAAEQKPVVDFEVEDLPSAPLKARKTMPQPARPKSAEAPPVADAGVKLSAAPSAAAPRRASVGPSTVELSEPELNEASPVKDATTLGGLVGENEKILNAVQSKCEALNPGDVLDFHWASKGNYGKFYKDQCVDATGAIPSGARFHLYSGGKFMPEVELPVEGQKTVYKVACRYNCFCRDKDRIKREDCTLMAYPRFHRIEKK